MDRDFEIRQVDRILEQAKRMMGVIETHSPALQRLTESGDDGAAWMSTSLEEASEALKRVIAAHRGMTFSQGDRRRWWSWYFADYRELPRSEAERSVEAVMGGQDGPD